jgi:hypothetical protein
MALRMSVVARTSVSAPPPANPIAISIIVPMAVLINGETYAGQETEKKKTRY